MCFVLWMAKTEVARGVSGLRAASEASANPLTLFPQWAENDFAAIFIPDVWITILIHGHMQEWRYITAT